MQAKSPAPKSEDPFRYGWRDINQTLPNGTESYDQIPLTLGDVLHPQFGDTIPQSDEHSGDCRYIMGVLGTRLLTPPFALFTNRMLIDWGVEGVQPHAPDIGVFVGMKQKPESPISLLRLAELQGRCEFLLEVVYPPTRDVDVIDKMREYHAVGVPFYVLIDKEQLDGPRTIRAFRHKPEGYADVALDDNALIELPMVGLRLGLENERAILFDAATGEEFLDYAALVREREQSKRILAEKDQQIAENQRILDSLARSQA